MTIETVAGYIGIKHASFFIGLVGGILSLNFIKGYTKWCGKLTLVIGGGASAGYLEPPISLYFTIGNGAYVAFIIGLFGMSIAATILGVIQQIRWARLLSRFLNARVGKGDGE